MYKLAVADDEKAVVEGLHDIIDWASMGFELVFSASDGREMLQYLEHHPVDVILTDIKMTFVSGLEIARHVFETGQDCQVVILSGYQEFELARKALQYHVKYYLLKPTNIHELRKVFLSIRKGLDEERVRLKQRQAGIQDFQDLLHLYQEQFFSDLLMGGIRTSKVVDERIQSRLKIEPGECPLCVVLLELEKGKSGNDSGYRRQAVDSLLQTSIKADDHIQYYKVPGPSDQIQIAAIPDYKMQAKALEQCAVRNYQKIAENYHALFGLNLFIADIKIFSNLYKAAEYYKPMIPLPGETGNKLEDVLSSEDMDHLNQQKKMFLSYISSNNLEMAQNLFENCMDELSGIKLNVIQNFAIDLFASSKNCLENLNINMTDFSFDYASAFQLKDISQIKKWGKLFLERISGVVQKHEAALSCDAVDKAKDFIQKNYNRDIGLEEVAEQVFLSPIYFSRLFKQKTGSNFIDYITKVRICHAKELLRNPKLKIYEISCEVGYRSTKYFYKIFKDRTGVTPTEYREQIHEGGFKNDTKFKE